MVSYLIKQLLFLSNSNILHPVMWFWVFLSDTNDLYTYTQLYGFLSNNVISIPI